MVTTKCLKLCLKLAQSRSVWDHSRYVPQVNKITIAKNRALDVGARDEFNRKGKSKTSSTSKIRNTIAIKKKWVEKGLRDLVWGINPHSKGLSFSDSQNDFMLKI